MANGSWRKIFARDVTRHPLKWILLSAYDIFQIVISSSSKQRSTAKQEGGAEIANVSSKMILNYTILRLVSGKQYDTIKYDVVMCESVESVVGWWWCRWLLHLPPEVRYSWPRNAIQSRNNLHEIAFKAFVDNLDQKMTGAGTSSPSKIMTNICSMKFPPLGAPTMLRYNGKENYLLRFENNLLETSLLRSDRMRPMPPLTTFE